MTYKCHNDLYSLAYSAGRTARGRLERALFHAVLPDAEQVSEVVNSKIGRWYVIAGLSLVLGMHERKGRSP